LAIETGCFLKRLYHDPGMIKRRLVELKHSVYDAFRQRENESAQEFKKRRNRNIAITVVAVTLIAGALACPFTVLPTAFAIPAALSAAFVIGKISLAFQRNPNAIKKVVHYLKNAFVQRPDESDAEFRKRKLQAIKRIVVFSLVFAGAVTAIVLAPYISMAVAKASSVWALTDIIPFQSEAVVFAEYLLVGALHVVQAVRYFIKKDYARGAFHASAAASAIFFPFWYMFAPGNEMRLHHSFMGLVLQLAPSQAVRTLGTAIVMDSAFYCISPQRGYRDPHSGRMSNYDLMNGIYDNLPMVLQAMVAITLLEKTLAYFTSKPKKTEDKKAEDIESMPVLTKSEPMQERAVTKIDEITEVKEMVG